MRKRKGLGNSYSFSRHCTFVTLNTVLLCFIYSFICKPVHSNSDENEKLIFTTSILFGHTILVCGTSPTRD